MADFAGIAAAGRSLEALLNYWFEQEEPVPGKKTKAVLVRSADFDPGLASTAIGSPALSVFLYRIDTNRTMRAAWSGVGSQEGRAHLPVDLHYLLTPWADNAEYEHRVLGKALQCLEGTPVLSGPLLHPSGSWATNESIQVTLEDVPADVLARAFDSLPGGFRLSVPYLARIVRIDGRQTSPDTPATTLVTGMRPGVRG